MRKDWLNLFCSNSSFCTRLGINQWFFYQDKQVFCSGSHTWNIILCFWYIEFITKQQFLLTVYKLSIKMCPQYSLLNKQDGRICYNFRAIWREWQQRQTAWTAVFEKDISFCLFFILIYMIKHTKHVSVLYNHIIFIICHPSELTCWSASPSRKVQSSTDNRHRREYFQNQIVPNSISSENYQ